MARQSTKVSRMFCTSCGKEGIPVARTLGQTREPGHLKKMYCINCKEETNHVEVRPYGRYTEKDFRQEYDTGRFVNGVRTPVKYLSQCRNFDCFANVNGRCWNSEQTIICKERGHE